jgi:alpha-N-acetylglucosamine transferase
MKYSYVSILTTDSYAFGALALWKSLMDTQPKHPFHLLITPNLSKETMDLLETSKIKLIKITPIKNPILDDPNDRRYYNYSKLNMWSLTQFEKIVYLDADMIVLHNIDELFEKKNMSSTNSGGWLPDKKDWKEMNSGLIVLEPSTTLFEHMKSQVGQIEKEQGKGDQAFLHQYYHDWAEKKDLHLPHIYNIFDIHLKGYKKHFGYYVDTNIQTDNKKYDEKRVKIVHYIGQKKPWHMVDEIKAKTDPDEEWEAKKLWVKYYKDVKKHLRDSISLKK